MPSNPTNSITPDINRLRPSLVTLARNLLKQHRHLDPEDIVQDSILVALTEQQNRSDLSFPDRAAAFAWLSTIVRNRCRSFPQAERLRDIRESQAAQRQASVDDGDHFSPLIAQLSSKMLHEVMDRTSLTQNERRVVLYRIETDASWREVAEHFGLSEVNCRVIYHRALQSLKSTWESMQPSVPEEEM